MTKQNGKYLLVFILIGMAIMNLFNNLDFTHQIINLIGLGLLVYSLVFKNWGKSKDSRSH